MAMNNNSFDPYAVGDGRAEDHGYMSAPVIDMDMNMPVEPPMEVEPEMPFDPVEIEPVMESEPAVVPAPERRVVPVTHRVIGNLRRMRDVMHLDDRGVVADRSQPGKDNGATLVELKGGAVALVLTGRTWPGSRSPGRCSPHPSAWRRRERSCPQARCRSHSPEG